MGRKNGTRQDHRRRGFPTFLMRLQFISGETTGHMADEDNLQYNNNVKKAKDLSRINSLLQGINLTSQSLSKTARPVPGI